MIECGSGVFVACLPILRPLLGRLSLGKVLNSLRGVLSLQPLWSSPLSDVPSVQANSMVQASASHAGLAQVSHQENTWTNKAICSADNEKQVGPRDREIVVESEIMQSTENFSA